MDSECENGHPQSWKCYKKRPLTCDKCEKARKAAEAKKKAELKRQHQRETEEWEHAERLAKLEAELVQLREIQADARVAEERENVIRQKEKDLAAARAQLEKMISQHTSKPAYPSSTSTSSGTLSQSSHSTQSQPPPPPSTQPPCSNAQHPTQNASRPPSPKPRPFVPSSKSPSELEWQRQKNLEGADNEHIDAIMSLVGLEDVKAQALRIKAKIDLSKRQNTSVKEERFNIVLLGNPGTGTL